MSVTNPAIQSNSRICQLWRQSFGGKVDFATCERDTCPGRGTILKWSKHSEFCARPIDVSTVSFTLEPGGGGELFSVLLCCCCYCCLLRMSTVAAAVAEFFPHLQFLFVNTRTRLGGAPRCCCCCCCFFPCYCNPARLPRLMLLCLYI